MHKAILISQAKEKDMADNIYDDEILTTVKNGFADNEDGRDLDKHAWDLVSIKVRERDENKCKVCGTSRDKAVLEVHHKNGNQKDHRLNNLETLCVQCHNNRHVSDKNKKKDEYTIDKADQFRIDFIDLVNEKENDEYLVEKFEKTPDGYLKGRSIITNVGVFSYMQPDGSIQRELRLPEEVFNTDTVEGFKMLPLTNGHPAEPVNIENVKQLQVGYLGDDVRSNSFYLSAPIMITDSETIAEVQSGKRGLSAGYKCDLERKSGTWLGMQYDAVQRNIKPNHTALVDRGRAGDDARIKMDSMGALGVQIIDQILNKGEVTMPTLKKIRLDNGVEYEAEDKVIEAYTSAQKKVDELDIKVKAFDEQEATWKKDKSALEAERDQFKEEAEKLKKDLAEAEKLDSQKLNEALEKKMILLDAARRADVDATNKEDEALKREIILKMWPSAKDKLDKADEVYVNARFDAALEHLDEYEKEKGNTNQFLAGDSIRHTDQADSPQKSRENMMERQLNAWKKDKDKEEK
jgi:hypothetical protein